MIRSLSAAVLLAALALGSPALAGTGETIATASSTPAPTPDDTAAQVRQFIAAAPPPNLDDGQVDGVVESGPRQVHGEVGVSVGTGGYRSAYAISALPVGKTGTLTVAVGETRFGRNGGYGYGRYGAGGTRQSLGLSFDMSGSDPGNDRCRPRSGGLDGAEPLPPVGWGVRQDCRANR